MLHKHGKKRLRLICITWEPLFQSWAKSEQFWVRNKEVEVMQQTCTSSWETVPFFLFFSGIFDECSQLDTGVEKVDVARVGKKYFCAY